MGGEKGFSVYDEDVFEPKPSAIRTAGDELAESKAMGKVNKGLEKRRTDKSYDNLAELMEADDLPELPNVSGGDNFVDKQTQINAEAIFQNDGNQVLENDKDKLTPDGESRRRMLKQGAKYLAGAAALGAVGAAFGEGVLRNDDRGRESDEAASSKVRQMAAEGEEDKLASGIEYREIK